MVVRAPFSGVAISKDAQPGEMISPVSAGGGFTRTGICTIVDMSSLEIEVDVNESYINRVHDGQPVEAVLDAYPDWRIPAHVITTIPSADRQKATVKVRIGFDAARSAHPARHGREGLVPARARRPPARRRAAPRAARAEGGGPDGRRTLGRLRRATTIASSGARSASGSNNGDQVEVLSGVSARRARGGRRPADAEGRRQGQGASDVEFSGHGSRSPQGVSARRRAHRRPAGRQPRHSARAISSR